MEVVNLDRASLEGEGELKKKISVKK